MNYLTRSFDVLLTVHLSLILVIDQLNLLAPNDDYRGRTAQLTSKRFILYSYSTNTGNEYFKHGIYSPFFPLQNAVSFIILTYLVPVLFTFYIQGVLKLKKNNSGAKRLMHKIVFYNKFIISLYMFRALCAHHQEVKIVLYILWYHHTQ